jgi:predicted DNA binding CopG/RHH family protein
MSGKQHKRTNRIEVRLNDQEMAKLKAFADTQGQPMTECIRDWIKSLPS